MGSWLKNKFDPKTFAISMNLFLYKDFGADFPFFGDSIYHNTFVFQALTQNSFGD